MDMKHPLLTIIIPTKNSAITLKRTLQSINFNLCKTWIFDAYSNDETLNIAKQFPVIIKQTMDSGAHDAYNKGILVTSTPFIMFLNSDDYLMPGTLEAFYEILTHHPEAKILSLYTHFVNQKDKHLRTISATKHINLSLFHHSLINSRIYRTNLFTTHQFGPFLTHYKNNKYAQLADALWLFPLALQTYPSIPIKNGGYVYQIHERAMSNQPRLVSHTENYTYLIHFLNHQIKKNKHLNHQQKRYLNGIICEIYIKKAWIVWKYSKKHTFRYLSLAWTKCNGIGILFVLSKTIYFIKKKILSVFP